MPPPEPGFAMRARRTAAEAILRRRMFGRIDHMGVAVADLDEAVDLYATVYGMPLVHRETVHEQGVEAVLFDVGENHVELLSPLADETPVGRFLARRGAGLHHVAYQVADIESALRRLEEAGVRMNDRSPRTGIRDSRVAFVPPSAPGGVRTEIVGPAHGSSEPSHRHRLPARPRAPAAHPRRGAYPPADGAAGGQGALARG